MSFTYTDALEKEHYLCWDSVYNGMSRREELKYVKMYFHNPAALLNFAKKFWKEGIDYFHNGEKWFYRKTCIYKFELNHVKREKPCNIAQKS